TFLAYIEAAWTPADRDFLVRSNDTRLEWMRRFREMGGRLVSGTDMQFGGIMLHRELRNLQEAGLSPVEVIAAATREAAAAIRIPSFKTEETRVARWLADFCQQRGYRVDLQEVESGRFQMIATLPGSGAGKSLMFNGHIDIDPLAFGWTRDPWTPVLMDDRLY